MKNIDWKLYVKKINDFKENCKEKVLKIEIDKLKRAGAIVLAVLTIAGSLVIVFKIKQPKMINNKPAKAIELKMENNGKTETQIFLEHVEQLKSGLYEISTYVFGEETMRMNETFGKSSKNFVTVQADFKIKYSVDVTRIRTKYDFDKKEVILQVPKDAVGVDSVELIGKVTEIERKEDWINKITDFFTNDDEMIKENAINQLLTNSKVEAQKYDQNELQQKAEKSMKEIVDKINMNKLKYRIEFVDKISIGIK